MTREAATRRLLLPLLAVALAGCAGTADEPDTTVRVFAAASLGDSFAELEQQFEHDHPGVDVQLNLAGSSSLVEQILAGAPADVFAAADEPTMERAVDAGAVQADPQPFATNVLTLVTPPDNPAGISDSGDLAASGPSVLDQTAADDVTLVVCAPQVPCGHATQALARDAGVELSPASEESSVTDVLGKVTSGEADAGLVYVTDALSAGDAVRSVEIENADAAVNTYPIAVLDSAPPPARDFVDFVRSETGCDTLQSFGFGAP
ncbi:molybdate ABC transporter substrate-binding protein [Citricoccus sp. GCM10030269]|uniref:molybdate ABC transporter substrate-binding protein n=1 Tax=Citricoccus sp. GCM10030269 TaxID=3273388 RepID=UPI0036108D8E